jgi:hypothetical protein
MQLIRIILSVILLVIGSILGEGYKNILYLYWLITIAFLIIYAEFITTTLISTKGELNSYKDRVSLLTMLKGNGGNIVQISIIPNGRIIVNKEIKIDIYATFATPVNKIPDLKIVTENDWEIRVSNQIQHKRNYAGKVEYILNNSLVDQFDDKFIKYSFFIKIDKSGQQNFKIELNNGNIGGELKNSFMVHAS